MSWVPWAKRSLPMLVARSTGKLILARAILESLGPWVNSVVRGKPAK